MLFKKLRNKLLQEKRQKILQRIKPVLAKQFEIDGEEITPVSKIVEDFGADSLDAIEITMELENEFNIDISDEDAEKMKTVDDIITYLMEVIK